MTLTKIFTFLTPLDLILPAARSEAQIDARNDTNDHAKDVEIARRTLEADLSNTRRAAVKYLDC